MRFFDVHLQREQPASVVSLVPVIDVIHPVSLAHHAGGCDVRGEVQHSCRAHRSEELFGRGAAAQVGAAAVGENELVVQHASVLGRIHANASDPGHSLAFEGRHEVLHRLCSAHTAKQDTENKTNKIKNQETRNMLVALSICSIEKGVSAQRMYLPPALRCP